MSKSFKSAGVFTFITVLCLCGASPLHAETLTVGGWAMTFPDSTTGTSWIGLTRVSSSGSTLIIGEKDAIFAVNNPLPIEFQRESTSADSAIDIQTEAIVNSTSSAWSSFNFQLMGNATFASAADTFALPTGYTSHTFSSQLITYSGTQAGGDVSFWGLNADGSLVINPGTSTSFFFTEFPDGSGVTVNPHGGGTAVSLPAGVWQGLSGLAGLGLILAAKNLRKHRI
jgi:hypothetical protein